MAKLTLNEILDLAEKVTNWKKDRFTIYDYSGKFKGVEVSIRKKFMKKYEIKAEWNEKNVGHYIDRKAFKELYEKVQRECFLKKQKEEDKELEKLRALLK